MEPLKLGQIRQRNGNNEITVSRVMKNHEKEKEKGNNKNDEIQYYHFKVAVIILVFIAYITVISYCIWAGFDYRDQSKLNIQKILPEYNFR